MNNQAKKYDLVKSYERRTGMDLKEKYGEDWFGFHPSDYEGLNL